LTTATSVLSVLQDMRSTSPTYHQMVVAVLTLCLTGCSIATATRPHRAQDPRAPTSEFAPLPRAASVAGHANALHCPVRARACVDVGRGLAWLQTHGSTTYGPVPIATGSGNHATPSGDFIVQWKARHWVSTEYGVPMPYSVFFASGGIAFHEGPLHTHSHGCVHLGRDAAREFFHRLPVGAHVHVTK
jgi:L,D-transpeptidase-like protein